MESVFLVCTLPAEGSVGPHGPLLSSPETRDSPIDPAAARAAEWLYGSLVGRAIPVVRSGPEVRCRLTAVRLCHRRGSDRDRLVSEVYAGRRWGSWSGMPREEADRRLARLNATERRKFAPPGGESWMDVERRIRPSLLSACGIGESFALVANLSVCRVASGVLTGSPDFARNLAIESGGFIEFRHDGRTWQPAGSASNPPPDL